MKPEIVAFFRAAFLQHGPQRYAVMQPHGADRKYDDFTGPLTDRQINAHLDGQAAYAVPYAEAGLASVLAFDIDAGGIEAAEALITAAQALEFWAFAVVDPERDRGYVWVPFDGLANVARLHALGEQLTETALQETEGARRGGERWRIENRASEADTRLPFARHVWTGRRGVLLLQTGQQADLDAEDKTERLLTRFAAIYRENPTDLLPPPAERPARNPIERRSGSRTAERPGGITIASYNAATDLVQLLEHYGAKRAKGQGARLYFCPFHADSHASLIVSRDGEHCHCYSAASECPLSVHQHDAFNVFCIGEGITPQQALRRLNGLPDDPEPGSGPRGPANGARRRVEGQGRTFSSPPLHPTRQRPAEAPRSRETKQPATHAEALEIASQEPPEAPRDAMESHRLPKAARRVLAYLAEQRGDYCRGKYHLADVLEIDPRTVQRSLRRLEAEGLIVRTERGRDGQTDIYRLAGGEGATKRVSVEENAAEDAPRGQEAPASPEPRLIATDRYPAQEATLEGRQLPPTYEHDSNPTPESLEAARGGSPPASQLPDDAGAIHGPAGAFVIPGGAAYIPPAAAAWYAQLPAELRGDRTPEPPRAAALEPEPLPLEAPTPADQPEPRRSPARRRRTGSGYVDPGRLHGRIIAAERKVQKLEAEGTMKARAQARAIHAEVARLKLRLEMQQEGHYSAEEAAAWQPPVREHEEAPAQPTRVGTTTPPCSSSRPLDWPYLERLYRIGEQRAIEIHCVLCRADLNEVLHALASAR